MNQNRQPDFATDCAANAIHSPGSTRFRPRFFNFSAGFLSGLPSRRQLSPRNSGDSPDFLRRSPDHSGGFPRCYGPSPDRFGSSPDGSRLSPGVASRPPDSCTVPPAIRHVPPMIFGFPPTVLAFPRPGELFPRLFFAPSNAYKRLETDNLDCFQPSELGKPSKKRVLPVLAPTSGKSAKRALDLAFEITRQIQNQKV